jgi:hypothetical protein
MRLQGTRNVGAEASAYALGVASLLQLHPSCSRAVLQCDFLNALAFDCAAAKCSHPLLQSIYARVKAEFERHAKKALHVVRVHHPGHQLDRSWCTKLPLPAPIALMRPARVIASTSTAWR